MSAQFNDEPTLNDQFGRKGWVKWFGENMRNCEPPFVFSVHGDWGSGKTSFLYQLYHYLTGNSLCPVRGGGEPPDDWGVNRENWPHRVVVWFEAWRFQHEAAPVVQLLHEMRKELATHTKAPRPSDSTDRPKLARKQEIIISIVAFYIALGFMPRWESIAPLLSVAFWLLHVYAIVFCCQLAQSLRKNLWVWVCLTLVPVVNLFVLARMYSEVGKAIKEQ